MQPVQSVRAISCHLCFDQQTGGHFTKDKEMMLLCHALPCFGFHDLVISSEAGIFVEGLTRSVASNAAAGLQSWRLEV